MSGVAHSSPVRYRHDVEVIPDDEAETIKGLGDIDLYRRYAIQDVQPVEGSFVDFLGRVTDSSFPPSIAHLKSRASSALPVPGDGFYAEVYEYTGLLRSIDRSTSNTFVGVEPGAGWGPWTAAAGVAARRRNFETIHLVAVEASLGKMRLLDKHLSDNNLKPDNRQQIGHGSKVTCRCVHGAIWTEDGTVFFPEVSAEENYGAAANATEGTQAKSPIPAYTIETILKTYDVIDFIHMDIQGSEAKVCAQAIGFLKARCRYIFIGTHSRFIEGEFVTIFLSNGFETLREKPCHFRFDGWTGILEEITCCDGGQLLVKLCLSRVRDEWGCNGRMLSASQRRLP